MKRSLVVIFAGGLILAASALPQPADAAREEAAGSRPSLSRQPEIPALATPSEARAARTVRVRAGDFILTSGPLASVETNSRPSEVPHEPA